MKKLLYLIPLLSLLFGCSDDKEDTPEYYTGQEEIEPGVDLFDEDAQSVILSELDGEKLIEFSGGPKVTFCWITSQKTEERNCWFGKYESVNVIITGNCYFPTSSIDGYMAGEVISDIFAYPLPASERYIIPVLTDVDWTGTGVEIVDTHVDKDIPYDNCEFVYRGWLQVTLGGADEEHRFIKLKSIAEATEGYEVARLYFNPAYKFVNNMITVTQQGYSPTE